MKYNFEQPITQLWLESNRKKSIPMSFGKFGKQMPIPQKNKIKKQQQTPNCYKKNPMKPTTFCLDYV